MLVLVMLVIEMNFSAKVAFAEAGPDTRGGGEQYNPGS